MHKFQAASLIARFAAQHPADKSGAGARHPLRRHVRRTLTIGLSNGLITQIGGECVAVIGQQLHEFGVNE